MRKTLFQLILAISLVLPTSPASAQVDIPAFGKHPLLNGYAKALSGESITYFSVFPKYAKEALLTRCTDGKKSIEWLTDEVPAKMEEPYLYFSWIAAHSTGSSGGSRNFDLYINDAYALSFTTLKKNYPASWKFDGKDGISLVFELKTRDGAGDAHGMAYLRVPSNKYVAGKSLKLKVVGQDQQSNDWYMTFKYSFKEKVDGIVLPFLLREGNGKFQPLQITALHFGPPDELKLEVAGLKPLLFEVKNGFNTFQVPVLASVSKQDLYIKATLGTSYMHRFSVVQTPVIYREVNLMHHSHTDIGYSHLQEEVEKIHVNNIYQALHMIEKTSSYPLESRFKWNIESSWAAENFLKTANESDKNKFFRALRNHSIALAGTYSNELTGISTPEEISWNYDYASKLGKQHQFPVVTGMMTDIPGMSWSAVKSMAQHGIRYFSDGPNYMDNMPDLGDRIGHTIRALGDKPFWWKSSDDKDSLLFWVVGKGYSSWHGFAPGAVFERGAEKIAQYMNQLKDNAYPYTTVQWRYNIVSDNGPIDSTISDFVKDWNQRYVSPKLILANVNDLFEKFEKDYGKTLPVLAGDFTGYWEDGAYSTAQEENEVKELSHKILSIEKFCIQNKQVLNQDWLYQAKKFVMLFQEHTWGSWNSISDPENSFTIHQWEFKKHYIDSLQKYVRLLENELQPAIKATKSIAVVNVLPWNRTAYVEINAKNLNGYASLTDEKDRPVAVQQLKNGNWLFLAENIPANGQTKYNFISKNTNPDHQNQYVFSWSPNEKTGALAQVKSGTQEWVDPSQWGGLIQAIYVKGLNPKDCTFSKIKKTEWLEKGPLYRKCKLTASLEGCNEIIYYVEEFAGLKQLKLTVAVDKQAVQTKESLHFAFPFQLKNPKVRIGIDSTFISPDAGQIPGSNKDFFCAQRWIDISETAKGVTLSSPQGTLYEVGSLIDEQRINNGYKKWKTTASSSNVVFLYAMNNYWHTNYKADQTGIATFEFNLDFHQEFKLDEALRKGYETTQPLMVIYR